MYGILVSAFNTILAFVLKGVIVKFGVFFGLFFVATGFVSYLAEKLPTATSITQGLGGIAPDMWYFLDLFGFSAGVPIILTAFVTRFCIRRLPVIG